MTLRKRILFLFVFMCQFVSAQNDSITNLNEVVVSDTQLKKYSTSHKVQIISDSIIQYNKPSLTSLLNYNTLLYFKEYGLGMTSSVAFRGTTAGQTAVIWNGININSQLLGQTDFNTITTSNFNSINVRSGGGEV
jgi:outer membrane cobalamin receptor